MMHDAKILFENSLEWLKANYSNFQFFLERDVVWTIQTKIIQLIKEKGLPFKVFNDFPILPGKRRSITTDLAIINIDKNVEVAAEFKYEPSHRRTDLLQSKFPVVFWGKEGVEKDVHRIKKYVEQGKTNIAYSLLIDEGGFFRNREPHSGCEWVDWGNELWIHYLKIDINLHDFKNSFNKNEGNITMEENSIQDITTTEKVTEFSKDDENYLRWIIENPDGFVINTYKGKNPNYMVLHRATCRTINELSSKAKKGGFTERDYIKICALTINDLKSWIKKYGRPDGSFSNVCKSCNPICK